MYKLVSFNRNAAGLFQKAAVRLFKQRKIMYFNFSNNYFTIFI